MGGEGGRTWAVQRRQAIVRIYYARKKKSAFNKKNQVLIKRHNDRHYKMIIINTSMRYNCCKYMCDHNGVSKYIK